MRTRDAPLIFSRAQVGPVKYLLTIHCLCRVPLLDATSKQHAIAVNHKNIELWHSNVISLFGACLQGLQFFFLVCSPL